METKTELLKRRAEEVKNAALFLEEAPKTRDVLYQVADILSDLIEEVEEMDKWSYCVCDPEV